jgi:type I restriction enzyme S subunit
MSKLTECKQTEIGEIPKDWNIAYLGDSKLADLIMGQSPPSATYNKVGEGLPFLQGNAEFGDKYPKLVLYCSEPIKIAERGDILVSVRAPVGDINIADTRLCIGRGLAAIRPKANILHNNFLYYHLRFNKSRFEMLSAGSTFKAIRRNEFDLYNISLPSFPEQRKIAEILGTVDEAIEKVDQAIEKTEQLKKGLMQELLTKGIGHKEFKDSEIGKIPKEWEVVKLADIALEFLSGGTPSTSNPDYWNGKIPWMTSAHISGKIITDGMRYITDNGVAHSATNVVPRGNILIATRVGIGKVAINSTNIAISQDLTGVVLDKTKMNLHYLYWQLSNYALRLRTISQGSTIKGLLRKEIEKIKILLPSFNEQMEIAEILDTMDKQLEIYAHKKQELLKIKKALMNDLLTGRRMVRIPHTPNSSPLMGEDKGGGD